ncbi:hypothetical protein [Azospirillum sp. sgz302134]
MTLCRWARRQPALRVAGFIDNRKTGHIGGVPVFTLDAFQQRRGPDDVVLVASQHVKEIGGQLEAAGVERWADAHPCAMHLIDRERVIRGRAIIATGLTALVLAGLALRHMLL